MLPLPTTFQSNANRLQDLSLVRCHFFINLILSLKHNIKVTFLQSQPILSFMDSSRALLCTCATTTNISPIFVDNAIYFICKLLKLACQPCLVPREKYSARLQGRHHSRYPWSLSRRRSRRHSMIIHLWLFTCSRRGSSMPGHRISWGWCSCSPARTLPRTLQFSHQRSAWHSRRVRALGQAQRVGSGSSGSIEQVLGPWLDHQPTKKKKNMIRFILFFYKSNKLVSCNKYAAIMLSVPFHNNPFINNNMNERNPMHMFWLFQRLNNVGISPMQRP